MKKINLKYLKDNLNLKKLLDEFDKLENSRGDDLVRDAVLDSYDDIVDDDMEISIYEYLTDNETELFSNICDLSFQGKLLQTLSKNFKNVRQIHIDHSYGDYYLQSVFSKINKTYYLLLSCLNTGNDFQYISYKTKSEKDLNKELGLLRNKIHNNDF